MENEDEMNNVCNLLARTYFAEVDQQGTHFSAADHQLQKESTVVGSGIGFPFSKRNRYKHRQETHCVFKFAVELESIIYSSDDASRCMYNKITQFILRHCQLGLDLSRLQIPTRLQLLKHIMVTYNLHNMKPTVVEIKLEQGPVTNIADRLQFMLADIRIMNSKKISKGLDFLTGKAIDDRYYETCSPPHTGKMWKNVVLLTRILK